MYIVIVHLLLFLLHTFRLKIIDFWTYNLWMIFFRWCCQMPWSWTSCVKHLLKLCYIMRICSNYISWEFKSLHTLTITQKFCVHSKNVCSCMYACMHMCGNYTHIAGHSQSHTLYVLHSQSHTHMHTQSHTHCTHIVCVCLGLCRWL